MAEPTRSAAAMGAAPSHVPATTAPFRRLVEETDEYLATLRFSHDPRTAGLEEAMRYSLLGGGKRIRPMLTLATARALGMDHRRVMPLAAAIELVHTLTLIHDDLPAMDDDDLRRGQPANHRVFGESIAILAGDTLFAEAFVLLLTELDEPPERVLAAARALAAAAATDGVAGGQYLDLRGTAEADTVLHMHRLKTGALFEACVRCVLELAMPADPRLTSELIAYARNLGLMFQIVDDLIDGHATAGTAIDGRLADDCLRRIHRCLALVPCDGAELLAIAGMVHSRCQ